MEIIQIIIIIFAIFALSRVILRFKKRLIKPKEFVAWILLWIFVIILALIPGFIGRVASIVGIGRGTDVLIYSSILVIFYLVFKMYLRLEKIERDITKVVRKLTLGRNKK